MTDEQVNELLAIKVMGWCSGQDPMHNLDCWLNANEKVARMKKDWSPITNISQAIECAEKWCGDNKKWCSFQIYYDEPYITNNEKWLADVAGNTVIDKDLARAICLALCKAVKK